MNLAVIKEANRPEVQVWDPSAFKPIRERGFKPPSYVLEGIIKSQGLNIFVGEWGSGKTTVVASMISSIHRGVPWAGRKTQARPVWIMDRENAAGDILDFAERLDIQDTRALFDHQFLWNIEADGVPPRTPEDPQLIDRVKACEADAKPVIVFDSFIAYLEGDENDAKTVRAFLRLCKNLCDLGATVVLPHHKGKSATSDYRGSSDIGAGCDTFWKVSSLDKPNLSRIEITPLKVRGKADGAITVKLEGFGFQRILQADNSKDKERNKKLGDLLRTNPEVSGSRFEELAAGIASRNEVRDFIKAGKREGGWVVDTGTRNAHKYSWKSPMLVPF